MARDANLERARWRAEDNDNGPAKGQFLSQLKIRLFNLFLIFDFV
jgi:hypothetical protein